MREVSASSCGVRWLVWLVTFALGCSSASQNLRPAAEATKAAGLKNAAIASDSDVVLVVQSGAWPGESRVTKEVTPLRVRVTNGHSQPIRVRYEDVRLIAADGTRYVALPPIAPQPASDERAGATADGNASAKRQKFTYSGFQVAPHLANAYPGLDTYRGGFDYDPQYYDKYGTAWTTDWLPTAEMKDWALPEGVLTSGGYIEGFIYFQRVDKNKGVVRFDSEFRDASRPDETIAKIRIPFVVED